MLSAKATSRRRSFRPGAATRSGSVHLLVGVRGPMARCAREDVSGHDNSSQLTLDCHELGQRFDHLGRGPMISWGARWDCCSIRLPEFCRFLVNVTNGAVRAGFSTQFSGRRRQLTEQTLASDRPEVRTTATQLSCGISGWGATPHATLVGPCWVECRRSDERLTRPRSTGELETTCDSGGIETSDACHRRTQFGERDGGTAVRVGKWAPIFQRPNAVVIATPSVVLEHDRVRRKWPMRSGAVEAMLSSGQHNREASTSKDQEGCDHDDRCAPWIRRLLGGDVHFCGCTAAWTAPVLADATGSVGLFREPVRWRVNLVSPLVQRRIRRMRRTREGRRWLQAHRS